MSSKSRSKTYLQCHVCMTTFSKKSHLDRHYRTHTKEQPYKCDTCFKRFTRKENWKKHLNTQHLSDIDNSAETTLGKNDEDGLCSKNFSSQNSQFKNPGKAFQCSFCPKAFSLKSGLKKHTRTHTNEKPYSCDICLRSFCEKKDRDSHVRVHTGEKPYGCEFCPKTFARRNILARHKLRHTKEKPFQCGNCLKTFSRNYLSKLHETKCKNNLPLDAQGTMHKNVDTCSVCMRIFSNVASLKIHLRTHTREKPYECEICHKTFISKFGRDKHLRVHKEEKA